MIALGRLALTSFALVSIQFASGDPLRSAALSYAIAASYSAFAAFQLALLLLRPLTRLEQLVSHGADIVCVSLLMAATAGPVSPYFVFFSFILLAGLLRWGWRGVLGSTVLLVLSFIVLVVIFREQLSLAGDETGRAIIRAAYLMVTGAMLGYVGAVQERSRNRLAKIVAWPGPERLREGVGLTKALAQAADVLQASRVLVVWEQLSEPSRHLILWSPDGANYFREPPGRFGTLVSPALAAQSFVWHRPSSRIAEEPQSIGSLSDRLIDCDLVETYHFQDAITAPFRLPVCTGRVFFLNRAGSSNDDLLLVQLIADRIGVDLEHHLLSGERADAAAADEKARLARDLHDGILQGLAAASIQLKLSSLKSDDELKRELIQTRELLIAEQQRIRGFVETSRLRPGPSNQNVDLTSAISKNLRDLGDLWGCEIELTINPPGLAVSPDAAHQVRHILTEAVSNATRHGQARKIRVSATGRDNFLTLLIQDNGVGFPDLTGSFSGAELAAQQQGPRSIIARVKECGGTLALTTSPSGSQITIEMPL